MLKVCYIITKLELGGAQKFTLYTAEYIDKDRFGSFLITGRGGSLEDEAAKKIKLYSLANLIREISPLKDFKALLDIMRVLKIERPDIVHTHSSKAGILGRIAAKLTGTKTIIHTIHGYSFNETQSRHKRYLYIFLERFCSFFSDKLIVETEEDLKKGLAHKIAKKEKFTVISSGIDVEHYKAYKPQADFRASLTGAKNAKIIMTVGPFKPQKNLQDFIRAAAIVCKKADNAVFFIVGDGELRPELEQLITELNLQDKVILLGWRRDIIELLSACDIFAMTSLWEGLPRTILDAMCRAKPVIANAVGGIPEVIENGKNGFLTKPYDFAATAEKITALLEDEKLMLETGKNAKDSIGEKYDINYGIKCQEELYVSLSKNKK